MEQATPRFCKDCKHFAESPFNQALSDCHHPRNMELDLVNGGHVPMLSPKTVRSLPTTQGCSESAEWFERIDVTTTNADHMAEVLSCMGVVFEARTPDGHVYRVFDDGSSEGFPDGTVVINRFRSLQNLCRGRLLMAKSTLHSSLHPSAN